MGKQVRNVVKAAVIGAAIATGIGAIAAGGFGAISASFMGLSGATAYFAQSFVINAVLGVVSSALTPDPADLTSVNDLRGQTIMQRSPIAARKIVYGQVKTSGAIVFMEATDNNENLHYCVTMAGHEITAVDEVYFGETVVKTSLSEGVKYAVDSTSDPDYSGKAWVTAHFGDENQLADSNLVSETSMTSDHRLRGIAYLYAKLAYDRDVFSSGVPNLSAVVKGRAVYDPRTSTTVYSNNAALCILDYVRDSRYGIGATDAEIDFDSFTVAANICDENVALDAGGTEKRYTINGVIDTSKQPAAILQDMLSAMAGTIYYSNGQWKVRAGAYVTPTDTLSMDDVIGNVKITTRVTNQANFNAVKGVFLSPDDNWQPVDYPSVTSATFEAEDNGIQRFIDVTLPFTTSSATAQRLAKLNLYRNREQLTLAVPCNLKAFKYEVGDTLYFTNERLGFTNKVFEVVGWELANNGEAFGINLMLKETSSAVYSWAATDESALTRNNTTLPSAFVINPPTDLTTTAGALIQQDGTILSYIDVSWTSGDVFAISHEIQYRKGTDEFKSIITQGNFYRLENIEAGEDYDIQVRAISGLGVRSVFVSDALLGVGDLTAPDAPTDITATGSYQAITLRWTNPADTDFRQIEVWESSTTSSGDATLIALTDSNSYYRANLGLAQTKYYFLKSVDYTGNKSAFTTAVGATTTYLDDTAFEDGVRQLFIDQGLDIIEPVSSLPASGDFVGQQVFLTTTGTLYQWNGSAWVVSIADVADGSIVASDKIVANTITGGLLATSGIITDSAQINDLIVSSAKIDDLAVERIKIGDNAVSESGTTNVYNYFYTAQQQNTATTVASLSQSIISGVPVEVFFSFVFEPLTSGGVGYLPVGGSMEVRAQLYYDYDSYGGTSLGPRFSNIIYKPNLSLVSDNVISGSVIFNPALTDSGTIKLNVSTAVYNSSGTLLGTTGEATGVLFARLLAK